MVIVVTLSVCCLSVCLSVADLKDGRLLALQRDTNLKEYDDLSCFNLLHLKFGLVLEKKWKNCRLQTHSFTTGKVSSHNTRIV